MGARGRASTRKRHRRAARVRTPNRAAMNRRLLASVALCALPFATLAAHHRPSADATAPTPAPNASTPATPTPSPSASDALNPEPAGVPFGAKVVVVFPFAALGDLSSETGTTIAQAIAARLTGSEAIVLRPVSTPTERANQGTVARAADADYYVTGYVSPLGDGIRAVEQIVGARSGVLIASETTQIRTIEETAGLADAVRSVVLNGPPNPQSAATEAPEETPSPSPRAHRSSHGRRRNATPTPAPSASPAPVDSAPGATIPTPTPAETIPSPSPLTTPTPNPLNLGR